VEAQERHHGDTEKGSGVTLARRKESAVRAFGSLLFTPLGLAAATLSVIVVLSACCADRLSLFVLSVLICYAWYWARFLIYVIDLSKRPDTGTLRPQWSLRQLLFMVACLAVLLATVFHHWPFRARFLLSHRAFNELANRLECGRKTQVPKRIGFFVIKGASMRGSIPCLWLDSETCFARCKPEQAQRFNLGSTERMNDRWQLINED
jgi:hypothetical protein